MEKTPLKELLPENVQLHANNTISKGEAEVLKNTTSVGNKDLQNENANASASGNVTAIPDDYNEKENIRNQLGCNQKGINDENILPSPEGNIHKFQQVKRVSCNSTFNDEDSLYPPDRAHNSQVEVTDLCNDAKNVSFSSDRNSSYIIQQSSVNVANDTFDAESSPACLKEGNATFQQENQIADDVAGISSSAEKTEKNSLYTIPQTSVNVGNDTFHVGSSPAHLKERNTNIQQENQIVDDGAGISSSIEKTDKNSSHIIPQSSVNVANITFQAESSPAHLKERNANFQGENQIVDDVGISSSIEKTDKNSSHIIPQTSVNVANVTFQTESSPAHLQERNTNFQQENQIVDNGARISSSNEKTDKNSSRIIPQISVNVANATFNAESSPAHLKERITNFQQENQIVDDGARISSSNEKTDKNSSRIIPQTSVNVANATFNAESSPVHLKERNGNFQQENQIIDDAAAEISSTIEKTDKNSSHTIPQTSVNIANVTFHAESSPNNLKEGSSNFQQENQISDDAVEISSTIEKMEENSSYIIPQNSVNVANDTSNAESSLTHLKEANNDCQQETQIAVDGTPGISSSIQKTDHTFQHKVVTTDDRDITSDNCPVSREENYDKLNEDIGNFNLTLECELEQQIITLSNIQNLPLLSKQPNDEDQLKMITDIIKTENSLLSSANHNDKVGLENSFCTAEELDLTFEDELEQTVITVDVDRQPDQIQQDSKIIDKDVVHLPASQLGPKNITVSDSNDQDLIYEKNYENEQTNKTFGDSVGNSSGASEKNNLTFERASLQEPIVTVDNVLDVQKCTGSSFRDEHNGNLQQINESSFNNTFSFDSKDYVGEHKNVGVSEKNVDTTKEKTMYDNDVRPVTNSKDNRIIDLEDETICNDTDIFGDIESRYEMEECILEQENVHIFDQTLKFEDFALAGCDDCGQEKVPCVHQVNITRLLSLTNTPPQEEFSTAEGDQISQQHRNGKPRESLLLGFDPIYSSKSANITVTQDCKKDQLDVVDEQLVCFGNQLENVNTHLNQAIEVNQLINKELHSSTPNEITSAVTNNTEKLVKPGCDVEHPHVTAELQERAFIQKECSDSDVICSSNETAAINAVCERESQSKATEKITSDKIPRENIKIPDDCITNKISKVIDKVIPVVVDKVPQESSAIFSSEVSKLKKPSGNKPKATNRIARTEPKNVIKISKDEVLEKVYHFPTAQEVDKVTKIFSNKISKKLNTDVTGKTMADVSDKLVVQEEENAELKLQLNASQQVRASLELQLRQKEEIIIKSQAESLRKDQAYKLEIKQLKEKLEEKCTENDNTQAKELQETVKSLKSREAKLISELNARKNDEQNYRKIMDEYEKTIGTRLSELQKLNEEHETLKRHFANLELAFSDVHQKYERSKKIIDGFKCNEDALRQTLLTSEDSVIKSEEKYESLKAHAKAQIEKSNQEMQLMREQYESEIHKLSAIIRRLEIKNASLGDSLDQKKKECSALAALCDEVTGKV